MTAVMRHYAYARSDKKDEPRISIGGRLVADLLVTAALMQVKRADNISGIRDPRL